MIDWKVAQRTAGTLLRPGPELSADQTHDVIETLRRAAVTAEAPVREYTGLVAPALPSSEAPVLVVDRPRWVEANLATFATIMEPVLDKVTAAHQHSGRMVGVGSVVGGVEIGTVMSYLAGKVLGQFDPFWTGAAGEGGRLLLVAPNIVDVEQRLEVDPDDFRLWVALHEQTHRVQFTAVPWMRGHLRSLMDEMVDATDLDPQALSRLVSDGLGEFVRIVRGESEASLADLFQNDQQKAVVEKVTGVMSLLEGHADVVMDGVGPDVIPTVKQIRRRFEQRRSGGSGLDRLLRRLLGMETKLRQYRDGAVFVRHVVDTTGRDGFDAVWAEAANLPTRAEILDPDAWIKRVHA
ncbi:zinc-dependent metalloprotease [Aeromicrobium sp. CTD01-1L150]|uniref:zinc-dependent metalloprotease n=1 Tax=Aeromicrobium sp. CTD01-1L150 TaxID=3341830 RepID=UPI0035BF48C6